MRRLNTEERKLLTEIFDGLKSGNLNCLNDPLIDEERFLESIGRLNGFPVKYRDRGMVKIKFDLGYGEIRNCWIRYMVTVSPGRYAVLFVDDYMLEMECRPVAFSFDLNCKLVGRIFRGAE